MATCKPACSPTHSCAPSRTDDAADLDLNAKNALHALESIQHVTIDLGTTSIDHTSTPSAEQASILAALTAEAGPNTRA